MICPISQVLKGQSTHTTIFLRKYTVSTFDQGTFSVHCVSDAVPPPVVDIQSTRGDSSYGVCFERHRRLCLAQLKLRRMALTG